MIGESSSIPNKISAVHFAPKCEIKINCYHLALSCFPILLVSSLEEGVALLVHIFDSKYTMCQVWFKFAD